MLVVVVLCSDYTKTMLNVLKFKNMHCLWAMCKCGHSLNWKAKINLENYKKLGDTAALVSDTMSDFTDLDFWWKLISSAAIVKVHRAQPHVEVNKDCRWAEAFFTQQVQQISAKHTKQALCLKYAPFGKIILERLCLPICDLISWEWQWY